MLEPNEKGIISIAEKPPDEPGVRRAQAMGIMTALHNVGSYFLTYAPHVEQTPEIVKARRKLAHAILQEIKIARNEMQHNAEAVAMLEMWRQMFESDLKPPPRH